MLNVLLSVSKKTLSLFLIFLIGILLTGCSGSNHSISEYSLTITADPAEGGTVSTNPERTSYQKGSAVTLTSVPNPGWYFKGWQGDVTDTTNPVTVIIEQNMNIIAGFESGMMPGNNSPELDPIGDKSAAEQEQLTFQVTASDLDEDFLIFSVSGDSAPVSGSLAQYFNPANQLFNWTPAVGDTGSYSLTFMVADDRGGTDQETVNFYIGDVNHPPVLTPIGNQITGEDIRLVFTVAASDPEEDTLIYSVSGDTAPSSGSLANYFNSATRTFSWLPLQGDAGSYSMTFTVSDGSLITQETITISVGIYFPDAVLEGKIRDAVNQPEGYLLPTDVDDLIELNARGEIDNRIVNLSGIEYLVNLETANFNFNQITNITPLLALYNLTSLSLSNNPLNPSSVDLSPLASLPLESLNLSNSGITDSEISFITNLSGLKEFYCAYNSIENISFVENMTALEYLYLQDNQITDLDPLYQLANKQNSLFEINLTNNPLSITSLQIIDSLEDRGITVYY